MPRRIVNVPKQPPNVTNLLFAIKSARESSRIRFRPRHVFPVESIPRARLRGGTELLEHAIELFEVNRLDQMREESGLLGFSHVFGHSVAAESDAAQGGSLEMISDASLDFVFSFDVFVHIKREIVEEYLSELGRTLKPGGRGFIHHSNLGAYAGSLRDKLPSFLQKFLTRWHLLDEDHHRTSTMTAELFRALCKQHGLHCTRQELINWRGRRLIDCLSWFERSESGSDESTEVVRNPNFMREAEIVRRASEGE